MAIVDDDEDDDDEDEEYGREGKYSPTQHTPKKKKENAITYI